MTDKDIIKALGCCMKQNNCGGCCPYDDEDDTCEGCTSKLAGDALDLIKRQRAEIEQWKNEAICYQNLWCEGMTDLQTAKTEAYKDFAERLKEKMDINSSGYILITEMTLDNLVKELTEGSNGAEVEGE